MTKAVRKETHSLWTYKRCSISWIFLGFFVAILLINTGKKLTFFERNNVVKIYVHNIQREKCCNKELVIAEPSEKIHRLPFCVDLRKAVMARLTSQTNTMRGKCYGFHALSCEEPYLSRMLHIQNLCFKDRNKKCNLKTSSFKYIDKSKLVMCETPKAASTTWQILLLRLNGFKKDLSKRVPEHWQYNGIPNKTFKNLSHSQLLNRVAMYTSFMITRHPFERLVSAYLDKFSKNSRFSFYRQSVGRYIARYQAKDHLYDVVHVKNIRNMTYSEIQALPKLKNLTSTQRKNFWKYIQVLANGEVTFSQFVRFLIDKYYFVKKNSILFDTHWRPQVELCGPCAFNYSFIMHFENISLESDRLLEHMQRESHGAPIRKKIIFPRQKKRKESYRITTRNQFKNIPDIYVKKLREIYKDDFLYFDYDPFLYRGRKTN